MVEIRLIKHAEGVEQLINLLRICFNELQIYAFFFVNSLYEMLILYSGLVNISRDHDNEYTYQNNRRVKIVCQINFLNLTLL